MTQLKEHCLNTLRCIRAKGIGPKKFWDIYNACRGDIAYTKNVILKRGHEVPDVTEILKKHEAYEIGTLCFCDPLYPKSLRSIHHPPPILFYRGNIGLLKDKLFAIVGARNASFTGKKLAFQIANALCERYKLTVISGLAKGVDTSAHKGSVDYGTIAVIAQGLDIVYPKENESLYREIIDKGGLLLSEFEVGIPPTAFSFPMRSRIIAALCEGILIIEAALQSGTISTAKAALSFHKEMFVIPGSPLDPRYKGSHQLIKDGAFLVEEASDIVAHLSMVISHIPSINDTPPSPKVINPFGFSQALLDNMTINDPISIEELCIATETSAEHITTTLITLELEEAVQKLNDGRYIRLI